MNKRQAGEGLPKAGVDNSRHPGWNITAMLTAYIRSAMRRAKYEILSDDNSYYGEIPGFDGVYAGASTLEDCREELESTLEDWILFRVSRNLPMPEVNGLKLEYAEVA